MISKDFRNWSISLFKGKCKGYNHDVFAITITSKIIEASRTFLFNEFNLEFKRKVKPFMALVGVLENDIEGELHALANQMINNGEVNDVESIDSLLEITFAVTESDLSLYCKNISEYIKNNEEMIAVKSDKFSPDDADNNFIPKYHIGAWLTNEQYKSKFGDNALALCVDKFKIIADINLDKHTVKDVVTNFVKNGYITCGIGSSTIEKDITLSRGNEVRCYVLDMDKISKG